MTEARAPRYHACGVDGCSRVATRVLLGERWVWRCGAHRRSA